MTEREMVTFILVLASLLVVTINIIVIILIEWRHDRKLLSLAWQHRNEWMILAQDHMAYLRRLTTALREGRRVWPIIEQIEKELAKGGKDAMS